MAYTEDKAYELIKSAHSRGRLGHAFILSGTKQDMESLATRVVNLINKEEYNPDAAPKKKLEAQPRIEEISEPDTPAKDDPAPATDDGGLDLFAHAADDAGGDLFDMFGEVEAAPKPAPKEEPKPVAAKSIAKTQPAPVVEQKPHVDAKNLDELEGDLVRIIRPHSKSRIIKVDDIRELEKSMFQAADANKWKVGVVVDADRMQAAASNAFLKTLEEPPNGCLLLLLTHSPERLLPTILSRCVNITLMSSDSTRTSLEGEQELLTVLLRSGKQGFTSVSRALTIKSVFSSLLNKRKNAITKDYESAQKEEEKHYKNATDGEWLKEREKHFESLTQSDYLLERSKFIDFLILWLGDLVKLKSNAKRLAFTQQESAMLEVAEKETLESLLRRMEALEDLRGMFETNVSEALALEVGFMKAFG